MLRLSNIDANTLGLQSNRTGWPAMGDVLAATFCRQPRDHGTHLFDGTDARVTPVLTVAEAAEDPHLQARNAFVDVDGACQRAPAPLFSRTPAPPPKPARSD